MIIDLVEDNLRQPVFWGSLEAFKMTKIYEWGEKLGSFDFNICFKLIFLDQIKCSLEQLSFPFTVWKTGGVLEHMKFYSVERHHKYLGLPILRLVLQQIIKEDALGRARSTIDLLRCLQVSV